MTEHIAEFVQPAVGAIAGARVSLRMNRNALSLFDPDTRGAALEVLLFEVGCASTVLFFLYF